MKSLQVFRRAACFCLQDDVASVHPSLFRERLGDGNRRLGRRKCHVMLTEFSSVIRGRAYIGSCCQASCRLTSSIKPPARAVDPSSLASRHTFGSENRRPDTSSIGPGADIEL